MDGEFGDEVGENRDEGHGFLEQVQKGPFSNDVKASVELRLCYFEMALQDRVV